MNKLLTTITILWASCSIAGQAHLFELDMNEVNHQLAQLTELETMITAGQEIPQTKLDELQLVQPNYVADQGCCSIMGIMLILGGVGATIAGVAHAVSNYHVFGSDTGGIVVGLLGVAAGIGLIVGGIKYEQNRYYGTSE